MTPRPCNAAKDSSLCAVASDLSVTLDHVMLKRVVVIFHPRHEDGMSRNLDIVALTSIDSAIAQTILPSLQTLTSYCLGVTVGNRSWSVAGPGTTNSWHKDNTACTGPAISGVRTAGSRSQRSSR